MPWTQIQGISLLESTEAIPSLYIGLAHPYQLTSNYRFTKKRCGAIFVKLLRPLKWKKQKAFLL